MTQRHYQEISAEDGRFPEALHRVSPRPKSLWVSGQAECLKSPRAIAIVGARSCTAYGERIARSLACELARAGVTVVSGLAYGIDAAAHRGALEGRGRTVAVLGCGIDIDYPAENLSLRRDMEKDGAVVTEFAPGTPGAKWTFPLRNRIISGLSSGVVVIEATEKSGSLITAKHALDQGKEVFAVPGPIDSTKSGGTNRLIQDGAKLVLGVDDILEEFGWKESGRNVSKIPLNISQELKNTPEGRVLGLLSEGPCAMDALVERSGYEVETVSHLLISMEIEGRIRSKPGGVYERIS